MFQGGKIHTNLRAYFETLMTHNSKEKSAL
jgi:hypothetical protein